MSNNTNDSRRNFLKSAAAVAATAGIGLKVSAEEQKRFDRTGEKMRIVDFRCRPPIAPQKMLFDIKLARLEWENKLHNPLAQSTSPSMYQVGKPEGIRLLKEEMRAAGVDHIIMPGRTTNADVKATANLSKEGSINITDDMLIDLRRQFDNRATGLHGINLRDVANAPAAIEKAVKEHGLPGAVLEPGYVRKPNGEPLKLDDKSLYPIYETIVATDSVLMVQSGIYAGFDFGANDWPPLDLVLQKFPKMKVVLAHGGYPRVLDALALAMKHPNFYLSPDIYCSFPGGNLYTDAITQLQDQFIFGTAYPFGSLPASVEWSLKLPLADDVMVKYMGGNAARLLNL